jgi:hypothetical protein
VYELVVDTRQVEQVRTRYEQHKKHSKKLSENRTLKKIFGPKKKNGQEGEHWLMGRFVICTLQEILLGQID